MPEISDPRSEEPDRAQESGERENPRPDLQEVPENPPVEEQDLDRGRDKLDRVIPK